MEFALSQPKGPVEPRRKRGNAPRGRKGDEPGWADGLRQLYNSVLKEPLPDSFDDLLKKLDRGNHE
jgi:hypothetical protein